MFCPPGSYTADEAEEVRIEMEASAIAEAGAATGSFSPTVGVPASVDSPAGVKAAPAVPAPIATQLQASEADEVMDIRCPSPLSPFSFFPPSAPAAAPAPAPPTSLAQRAAQALHDQQIQQQTAARRPSAGVSAV